MATILAIAGKEIRVYLTTWTSYIIFGAFMLISAFFFQGLVVQFQQQSLQYLQHQYRAMIEQMNVTDWIFGPLLGNMTLFLLFMLPILTMRLIAEERRTKTLQLLMTTPVRPIEIVLGKYLAAVAMMLIMLGLTLVFPVLLHVFGIPAVDGTSAVDWSSVWVGYLGLSLYGATCVAIGLFASSITESQIVSVIIGFAVLLMLYVLGMAAQGETGFWREFFTYLSITTHLDGFVRGMIRLTDLVYYLSLSFVALFLTWRVLEAERWK